MIIILKYTHAIIYEQDDKTFIVKEGDYLNIEGEEVFTNIIKIAEGIVSFIETSAGSFILEGKDGGLFELAINKIYNHKSL